MLILGIETSCDETAVALLEADSSEAFKVTEELASQVSIHEKYGGVVPELASREHLQGLPIILQKIISDRGVDLSDINCIAVTRGPGLRGCLLIGLNFAKGLSLYHDVPLVGVNHLEGHVFSCMLDNPELKFPFVSLIVSGGHTELHLVKALGDYQLLARTADDAAGEAFDKSANLLGFSYPGGAALARLADTVQTSSFILPRVMREAEGFSFSGLKTAIMLLIKKHERELAEDNEIRAEIAHAVQAAIIEALAFKLRHAIENIGVKSVAVSGGVSANSALRRKLAELKGTKCYFPLHHHSVDNAAMIAFLGWRRFLAGERMAQTAEALDRWPLEQMAGCSA